MNYYYYYYYYYYCYYCYYYYHYYYYVQLTAVFQLNLGKPVPPPSHVPEENPWG